MKSFWVRGHLGCLMCWVQRSMGTWDYAPSAHELGSLAWARFLCSAILQGGLYGIHILEFVAHSSWLSMQLWVASTGLSPTNNRARNNGIPTRSAIRTIVRQRLPAPGAHVFSLSDLPQGVRVPTHRTTLVRPKSLRSTRLPDSAIQRYSPSLREA